MARINGHTKENKFPASNMISVPKLRKRTRDTAALHHAILGIVPHKPVRSCQPLQTRSLADNCISFAKLKLPPYRRAGIGEVAGRYRRAGGQAGLNMLK